MEESLDNKIIELMNLDMEIFGKFEQMSKNAALFTGKRNNTAGQRARVQSIELEKLFKKMRTLSLELEKEGFK